MPMICISWLNIIRKASGALIRSVPGLTMQARVFLHPGKGMVEQFCLVNGMKQDRRFLPFHLFCSIIRPCTGKFHAVFCSNGRNFYFY